MEPTGGIRREPVGGDSRDQIFLAAIDGRKPKKSIGALTVCPLRRI